MTDRERHCICHNLRDTYNHLTTFAVLCILTGKFRDINQKFPSVGGMMRLFTNSVNFN